MLMLVGVTVAHFASRCTGCLARDLMKLQLCSFMQPEWLLSASTNMQ